MRRSSRQYVGVGLLLLMIGIVAIVSLVSLDSPRAPIALSVPVPVPMPVTETTSSVFDDLLNVAHVNTINMTSIRLAGAPAFFVWYTDVVDWVMRGQSGEGKVLQTFQDVLGAPGARGDVIDIGANTGIYGMYAAMRGFRTYFVDPQPLCHLYLRATMDVNRVGDRTILVKRPLGRDDQTTLAVSFDTECRGNLRLSTASSFRGMTKNVPSTTFYPVKTVRLDAIYTGERILLVKIDTEGFEAEVLAGMTRLLGERRVLNMVVEVTPIFWTEFGMLRTRVASEIAALWDAGFTDVTCFANAHEPHTRDIHFTSKQELYDMLANGKFIQNDFYFHLTDRGV